EQVAVLSSETAVRGLSGERRSARTRERFDCREVRRSRKIWRQNHGAAAIGSGHPELPGLDTVALRLEVQGLVVHPEEPSCLALVPPRGVKCQADRLSLRLGGGAVGDLLQGEAHLFSSSVARSHGGADQPLAIRGPVRVIEVRRRYPGEQTRVTSESRRSQLPEPSRVNAVLLHLEVQGLVVGSEKPRRLALVSPRGLEGPADRPLLGVR